MKPATPEMLNREVNSPSYTFSFFDEAFLSKDELRAVRLQLEMMKPELSLKEAGIENTIAIFGSARTLEPDNAKLTITKLERCLIDQPDEPKLLEQLRHARRQLRQAKHYTQAYELAQAIYSHPKLIEQRVHVVTGGGPGIMEAANRGADDLGMKSIGLNIELPFEQAPNPFITPELCFRFHYFAIRKMHFLIRTKGVIVFPGGFGTLDELFETLSLIQTKKISPIPIILFDEDYWKGLINFNLLIEEGMIQPEDLKLFTYANNVHHACEVIASQF